MTEQGVNAKQVLEIIKTRKTRELSEIFEEQYFGLYFWAKLFPDISIEDFLFLREYLNGPNLYGFCLSVTLKEYKSNKSLYKFIIKENDLFGIGDRNHLITRIISKTSSLKKVAELVDMGINLREIEEDGKNLLFYAKSEKIINYLLSEGLDIKHVDKSGNTLLHQFLKANRTLCDCLAPLVNIRNDKGLTPLMHADHKTQIEFLLRNGADLSQTDKMERTALFYAWCMNQIDLLLNHGADINHQDKKGNTFLMKMVGKKHPRFWIGHKVFSLYHKDINLNIQNKKGETLLMLCLKQGENTGKEGIYLIEKIINHPEINLELKNKAGETALDYATESGLLKTYIKILLNKKDKESRIAI